MTRFLSAIFAILLSTDQASSYQHVRPAVTFTTNATCPGDTLNVIMKVSGAGGTAISSPPMDVVFSIDTSGSMYGSRLQAAKNAALSFVSTMALGDPYNGASSGSRAGLVGWTTRVTARTALTEIETTINTAINNLYASGSTNLNVGLRAAVNLHDTSDSIKAILFLTDGQGSYTSCASGGPAAQARDAGIAIHAIGVGSNFNSGRLNDMAACTASLGGASYSASNPNALDDIFDAIFTSIEESTVPHNIGVALTKSSDIESLDFVSTPDCLDLDNIDNGTGLPGGESVLCTFTAKVDSSKSLGSLVNLIDPSASSLTATDKDTPDIDITESLALQDPADYGPITWDVCNLPPVASGVPQDNAVELACDMNMSEVITFHGPEAADAVTLTCNVEPGPTEGLNIVTVDGDPARATINWDTSGLPFNITTQVEVVCEAADSFGLVTVVPLELTSEGPCNRPPEVIGSDVDISAMALSCGQGINDMNMTFHDPDEGDTLTLTYEATGETAGLNIIVTGNGTSTAEAVINYDASVHPYEYPPVVHELNLLFKAKDSFGLEILAMLPNLTSAGPCSVCTDSADVDADVAVPEIELRPNHYAVNITDMTTGVFTTEKTKAKGKPKVSFSLKDTKGCSCEDIIDVFGLGLGHRKFGCSIGVMKCYTEWVNSDSYDPNVIPDCVDDQDDELTEEAEDEEAGDLFGRYLRG